MDIKMVAKRFKTFRELKGYNITQVARESGVPWATIKTIERGFDRVSLMNIYRLCEYYGVPFVEMFSDGGEPPEMFGFLIQVRELYNVGLKEKLEAFVDFLYSQKLHEKK